VRRRLISKRWPRYTYGMKTKALDLLKLTALCVCLGLGLAGAAHAQWGWTDKDGRRIFSDQAPASEVPEKSIFKRPGGARAAAPVQTKDDGAVAATGTAVTTAGRPSPSASAPRAGASGAAGSDPALEKKKKELEAAEAAKQKAEIEKQQAAKADNCARAKKSKLTLNSGTRMATTNDKGEREIMGEAERAASVKRADDAIASDCK
jgi:hypothetical protein